MKHVPLHAKFLARWTNGKAADDRGYVDESLFYGGDGDFFIAGHGGPDTLYGELSRGGEVLWVSGRFVTGIDEYEARRWAAECAPELLEHPLLTDNLADQ